MTMLRGLGLALIVGGIILAVMGINATDAPMEQLTETLTGRYSDKTVWFIAGGAAAMVAGAFFLISPRGGSAG